MRTLLRYKSVISAKIHNNPHDISNITKIDNFRNFIKCTGIFSDINNRNSCSVCEKIENKP